MDASGQIHAATSVDLDPVWTSLNKKKRTSYLCRESNPRLLAVKPVAQCYTDWAIFYDFVCNFKEKIY
jgi:hypothetical protein